jgi:PIN domain nuclease of toxin-antitoxin system
VILLDTCTLLWLAADQKFLSKNAVQIISDNANALFISSISSFEIAVKYQKNKLELPLKPIEWIPAVLEHHGIKEIPVDSKIAAISAGLMPIQNDPADRIIIATSIIYDMTILTPDPLMKKYSKIKIKW